MDKESKLSLQKAARQLTASALNKGFLIRDKCEICGEHPADAHHDDYKKPLDVRWLCVKHHADFHTSERRKNPKNNDKKYIKKSTQGPIERSVKRMKLFRKVFDISILGYAKLAGVSESVVRYIDTEDWNPTLKTLIRLESVIPEIFKGE